MNIAEIKLDLFRRIDNLRKPELEKIYKKLLSLLNETTTTYRLSGKEKKAINKALELSEKGEVYSHEEVMEDAKQKYPTLRFK